MSKHGEIGKYTEKVARFQGYDVKKYTLEEIEELFSDDKECMVSQLCVDIRSLEAINTQMLQALKTAEWGGWCPPPEGFSACACSACTCCPVCHENKDMGHLKDCILVAALKKVREE